MYSYGDLYVSADAFIEGDSTFFHDEHLIEEVTIVWRGEAIALDSKRTSIDEYYGSSGGRRLVDELREFINRLRILISEFARSLPTTGPYGELLGANPDRPAWHSLLPAFVASHQLSAESDFNALAARAMPGDHSPNQQTTSLLKAPYGVAKATGSEADTEPRQRRRCQDQILRRVIVDELHLIPEALPIVPRGRPGTRQLVWKRLEGAGWTPSIFKKAWERFLAGLKSAE